MGISATVLAATTVPLPTNEKDNSGKIIKGAVGPLGEIDGVLLPNGGSLLLKDDAEAEWNGIYVVVSNGMDGQPWTLERRADLPLAAPLNFGGIVGVIGGQRNAGSQWLLEAVDGQVGSAPVLFVRSSSAPGSVTVGNLPGSEQPASTILFNGVAAPTHRGVASVDFGRIDVREYKTPTNNWPLAFEAALMELGRRKGGELYVPAGLYEFSRGVRVPDFIDETGRWCNVAPHGGLVAHVDGPYADHRFYVARVSRSGRWGSAMLQLSADGGINYSSGFLVQRQNGSPLPILELPETGRMKLRFASDQTFVEGQYCFWIGNGLGPVPPNVQVRGAGNDSTGRGPGQGTTLLRFNFSESGGMGDAFCFGMATTSNPGHYIAMSDLALENTSPSNHLSATKVVPSATTDAKLNVSGFPLRRDFDFGLEVVALEERLGRSLPVFRYRTGYRKVAEGPPPGFDEDWFRDSISLHDFVLPDALSYPSEIRAYLPGTGVRIHCPEGDYRVGDSFTWSASGYPGAGIVSYGVSAIIVERVRFFGFSRGISLHISNNSNIRSCTFSPSPFTGGSIGQEVVNGEACIGVWLTNFISDIRGLAPIPNQPSTYQPFNLAGGGVNIHQIEDCDFGRLAIGIWHEDGVSHTVRKCKFESTITCTEFGSVSAVLYEGCYYEGTGHCDEIQQAPKRVSSLKDFLPVVSFRGVVFGMNRGSNSPESANEVSVRNCYMALGLGIPIFRLRNYTNMSLSFEDNVLSGGRDPEGQHGRSPLIETGPNATLQCKSWRATVGTEHRVVARSRNGFCLIEPRLPNLGGLGIGTMIPEANLHVKAWAGIDTGAAPLLPLFKFESPAGIGLGPKSSYSLSADMRRISHIASFDPVQGSDNFRRSGLWTDLFWQRTNAGPDRSVRIFEWPMVQGECFVAEMTCIALLNTTNFAGYWKIRATGVCLGGQILMIGEPQSSDGTQPLGYVVVEHVAPDSGRDGTAPSFTAEGTTLYGMLSHAPRDNPINWTINTRILQTHV